MKYYVLAAVVIVALLATLTFFNLSETAAMPQPARDELRFYVAANARADLESPDDALFAAIEAWGDAKQTQSGRLSLTTYAPQTVLRATTWNCNFTGDMVVLNIEKHGKWRQLEWQVTAADLALLDKILAAVEANGVGTRRMP